MRSGLEFAPWPLALLRRNECEAASLRNRREKIGPCSTWPSHPAAIEIEGGKGVGCISAPRVAWWRSCLSRTLRGWQHHSNEPRQRRGVRLRPNHLQGGGKGQGAGTRPRNSTSNGQQPSLPLFWFCPWILTSSSGDRSRLTCTPTAPALSRALVSGESEVPFHSSIA